MIDLQALKDRNEKASCQPDCECPDGCNGCERMSMEKIIDFLESQRDLYPVGSKEHTQLVSLLGLHYNGYEP